MKTIVKTVFGSHLYGTSTPESDKDFKAVHMYSLPEIVLKKDKDHFDNSSSIFRSQIFQLTTTDFWIL